MQHEEYEKLKSIQAVSPPKTLPEIKMSTFSSATKAHTEKTIMVWKIKKQANIFFYDNNFRF